MMNVVHSLFDWFSLDPVCILSESQKLKIISAHSITTVSCDSNDKIEPPYLSVITPIDGLPEQFMNCAVLHNGYPTLQYLIDIDTGLYSNDQTIPYSFSEMIRSYNLSLSQIQAVDIQQHGQQLTFLMVHRSPGTNINELHLLFANVAVDLLGKLSTQVIFENILLNVLNFTDSTKDLDDALLELDPEPVEHPENSRRRLLVGSFIDRFGMVMCTAEKPDSMDSDDITWENEGIVSGEYVQIYLVEIDS